MKMLGSKEREKREPCKALLPNEKKAVLCYDILVRLLDCLDLVICRNVNGVYKICDMLRVLENSSLRLDRISDDNILESKNGFNKRSVSVVEVQ